MPTVVFTPQLERFLAVPTARVPGATVGEALGAAFAENPKLKSYLLDDQGALRRHVAVFVAGRAVTDREKLGDPVAADDEIYVFQALSGG